MGHVLLVDDDRSLIDAISTLLRRRGHRVSVANDLAHARRQLAHEVDVDVVVLDIRLHGENGLGLLAREPGRQMPPVIVLSGAASPTEAAQAIKLGATEFVEKTASPALVLGAIESVLGRSARTGEGRGRAQAGVEIVGRSPAMEAVRRAVRELGPARTSVVLLGETGTGKEVVAQALHHASGREGRYVTVNCAAIPDALAESELFGFERGAFSGAVRQHRGRIEQALRGTLLLDEVGEMRPELQTKLLRVLEDRAVERLGGTRPVSVDVRFLAATHRDLAAAVNAGAFRADLFYRLRVAELYIPPLRERPEDVMPLVEHFARQVLGEGAEVRIDDEASGILRTHRWPGNVRELRNVVERVSLGAAGPPLRIEAGSLRALLDGGARRDSSPAVPAPALPVTASLEAREAKGFRARLLAHERDMLREALTAHQGNVAATARSLGVDRGQLYRRLQALGLLARDGS